MDESLNSRIDRMFARDRLMAWSALVALWVFVAFVHFAVDAFVTDGRIRLALMVSAATLLVFNTASIAAMVRHYSNDRLHIYGLDIRHLDERRAFTIDALGSSGKRHD